MNAATLPSADKKIMEAALIAFRPNGGLIHLCAIVPNGAIEASTFSLPDEMPAALSWATKANRTRNVYFAPNPPLEKTQKRVSKDDVDEAVACWVDIDPDVAANGGYDGARRKLLDETLPRLKDRGASLIIDSGNGLQAFWLFEVEIDSPLDVRNTDARAEYEAINKRLAAEFGGDNVEDVCRIMRLPGTVNYPTPKKIKNGYPTEPTFSRVLHNVGLRYSLSEVAKLVPDKVAVEIEATGDLQLRDFGIGEPIDGSADRSRVQNKLDALLNRSDVARARWEGSTTGLVDTSDSSRDLSMCSILRANGFTYYEMLYLLEGWDKSIANGRTQGERYYRRMWDHSKVPSVAAYIEQLDRMSFDDIRAQWAGIADRLPKGVRAEYLEAVEFFISDDSVRAAARRRFELIPGYEYMNRPRPGWIVKKILPAADMGMVYGPSTSGKSFFVFDLVLAVARGVAWRERKVRQGRVAYVVAEGGGGVRDRLTAYASAKNIAMEDVPLWVVDDTPNLLGGDDLALCEAINAIGGVSLVVFDTLAQSMPGGDENSAVDMGQALSACRNLRRATGALVLLVHHAGKDETRGARGWSGAFAAMDVVIKIARPKDSDVRTAAIEKMKDGSDNEVINFRLEPVVVGYDEDGDEITSCVVDYVDAPLVQRGPNLRGYKLRVYNAYKALIDFDLETPSRRAVINEALRAEPKREDVKPESLEKGLLRAYGELISGNLIRSIEATSEDC